MDKPMSYLQKHPSITRDRVAKFLADGQWKDVNIHASLYKARASGSPAIELEMWSAPGQDRPTFEHAVKQEFAPIQVGHMFGPSWSTHWVRMKVQIPAEMEGKHVRLLFDPSCEALVWSDRGEPLQGITGDGGDNYHVDYTVTKKAKRDEHVRVLYLEVGCNGMFGNGGGLIGPPQEDRKFRLSTADLVVYNDNAWALYYDMEILAAMAKNLQDSPRGWQALVAANDIINEFSVGDQKSIKSALNISAKFFAAQGGQGNHQVYAIGNCHIDTAWLWPYDETKRKIARSWSTQLDYMERYPEYRFAASQAQQFEWLRTLYPSLFKRIQEKAKTGQFIPIGGTWIEMDCNIPSGESLARQFLLGQRFYKQHFGQTCDVFWLPDTFGYSSQLPQIVRLAGAKYFFTQKLSWNNINKFPHTTFQWAGLDGSSVLTHMAPANTYTAQVTVSDLINSVKQHKDVAYSNESLYLYGNGDGGGGPLEAMIERLDRIKDVDGLPRIKHAHPNEFYEHVEKTARDLVTWKGELYFELHRGTYTSQARTKQYNRQAELLLRDVEMLSVVAQSVAHGFAYPAAELDRVWKLVCLNQFHDVIPGSSIEMVYRDSDKIYEDVVNSGKALMESAMTSLFSHVAAESVSKATGVLFVNTTAWPRSDVVAVPGLQGPGVQQIRERDNAALVVAATVPGCGMSVADVTNGSADIEAVPVTAFKDSKGNVVLENIFVTAKISPRGHLVSLWDRREERELVPKGCAANVFRLHDDVPLFWDAWDIEIYNQEKYTELEGTNVRIVDEGPLLASVFVEVAISENSVLRQWISLSATTPRLDFDCSVDWHENRKCLKVAFAWDIYSDVATYETQFGIVQRPTHRNTTWDMAKFEVCGHKFADLSEHGYGVALLNDCKYGFSTLGNVMSMSLLRAPKAPDANCDMGHHSFRYAIYPHKGAFGEASVVREAYQFNVPLVQLPVDATSSADFSIMPFFTLSGDSSVVLDTVKAAEDNSSQVVVRMYEAYGGHARVKLSTKLRVTRAQLTNILEEHVEDAKLVVLGSKRSVDLAFKPFEVKTVKFQVKA
ncbi:Glycoside hydrolase, 38 vacuolar alpha mannosidase [Coemansia sp. RSA 2523]|nr:Glycoside hydrolase, 38 vacuolar alpha mannosidase [Coemansia sp. RSA 1824]KAJ1810051.1 Glycoside hydrolase, 38 vacuolar alpha mannosidase [Coemansia sp. RSA 2523]KAJ2429710.1 Glycoside hydrolase, 38 vacuolar alpha mannosidase [Coemansia sp. RSA 2524]